MQQTTHRLIVYDVSDQRRLQRLHKCCSQYALALQNSVFLFQGSVSLWQAFEQDLHKILAVSEDALWVFEIDRTHHCQQLGKKPLPCGIVLEGTSCLSAIII